jgi:pimeloyl-ACP methyl ester carboxylesterase
VRKLLRAAVRVLAVLALLLLSVITVQARSEQAERATYKPQGQLVDIGGGQLIHVRTWGARQHPSDPAIVLDVSAAMPLAEWAWVAQGLAQDGHFVVAYDRPGMGWSSGPWQPRDSAHAADALKKALDAVGIAPPYVIVAHSFGGFSARVFAGDNAQYVVGLALLDTSHPHGGGEIGFARQFRMRALQGHAGLFNVMPPDNWFVTLPADEQASANAVSHWTSHLDATAEELELWRTSAVQVDAASVTLRDVPLLVVAGYGSDAHIAQQRDMLKISTQSQFVQLNADHMGMLVNPELAKLTVQTIEGFVASL